jgi:hypothetical protein
MSLLRSGVRFTSYPTHGISSVRTFTSSASRCKQRLVILGSGWGGYEVLRGIDKKRWSAQTYCHPTHIRTHISREDVTIISPTNTFNFTPLLASCAVGTLEFRCAVEPVSVPVLAGILIGTPIVFPLTGQKILSASGRVHASSCLARTINISLIRLDCLPGLV